MLKIYNVVKLCTYLFIYLFFIIYYLYLKCKVVKLVPNINKIEIMNTPIITNIFYVILLSVSLTFDFLTFYNL